MSSTDVSTDVLVIGAGPAGRSAANETARAGLQVVVVDENVLPGGQIDRRPFLSGQADSSASDLLDSRVRFVARATCVGFDSRRRAVIATDREMLVIDSQVQVIATGALERVLPVPGWTREGVMAAGAAQTMLKGSCTFPYRRVVVAGSSPLLLATSAQLVRAGIEVAAVVEAGRIWPRRLSDGLTLLRNGSVLREGLSYFTTLLRNRVRIITGYQISEIVGPPSGAGVTGVVVQPRIPVAATAAARSETIECDAVLLSHGFTPATDLANAAGARLRWNTTRFAWEPERDAQFQTTVDGLWAVGDCAGVFGKAVAAAEGALAGLAIVGRLTGRPLPNARVRKLRRALRRHHAAQSALGRIWPPDTDPTRTCRMDTVVCRCQGTTLSQLTKALDDGASGLHPVKLSTRAGMGRCQGRTCAPLVGQLLAGRSDRNTVVDPPSVRFPIRPLNAGMLARWAAVVASEHTSDQPDNVPNKEQTR